VLAVPSVVIPTETNYLLNSLHSSFARIEIGKPMEFVTDLRLMRK
jgi:RES domain-containing protein